MDKKKILIVSKAFYPMIAPRSFRATELAKEFAKQGHNVTVLTHKRKYDYTNLEKKYDLKVEDFVHNKWKELKGKNILTKLLHFILNYLFLFPDIQLTPLLKNTLKKKKGFDLLISIAVPYPIHWGVALAKKNNQYLCKTWVADCGDPFMGDKERRYKYPVYFHIIENWFCKKPDYITIPIKEAIKAYPKKCRDKDIVIPQGFNFNEITYLNNRSNNINNPYPIFIYAGSLSKEFRNPNNLLKYLSSLSNKKFKFIIYTNNDIIDYRFKLELGDKLEIHEYVPREELMMELIKANFVLNFENKNEEHSPSKLIDYALLKKPILSINTDNINIKLINEFLNGNYSNQFIVKNIDEYNIKNVVEKFLKLI